MVCTWMIRYRKAPQRGVPRSTMSRCALLVQRKVESTAVFQGLPFPSTSGACNSTNSYIVQTNLTPGQSRCSASPHYQGTCYDSEIVLTSVSTDRKSQPARQTLATLQEQSEMPQSTRNGPNDKHEMKSRCVAVDFEVRHLNALNDRESSESR